MGVAFVAFAAWETWAVLSVRDLGVSARQPLLADKTAQLLDDSDSDLTLLVLASDSEAPVVSLLRQGEGSGSWLLGIADAPLPAQDESESVSPGEVLARTGRAGLVKAVSALAGVRIAHYVELDRSALAAMAGTESAVASTDVGAVESTQTPEVEGAAGRASYVRAALSRLTQSAQAYLELTDRRLAGVFAPGLARDLEGHVVSDLDADGLSALADRLGRDANAGQIEVAVTPTEVVDRRNIVSASVSRTLVGRMRTGEPFGRVAVVVKSVPPGSVTVAIQNGAGEDGVAGEAARILTREGYIVRAVGNANQFVYDKTLVVYVKDRRAAESVADALAVGKVVASRGMYAFTTDVLVVVGKDWPDTP